MCNKCILLAGAVGDAGGGAWWVEQGEYGKSPSFHLFAVIKHKVCIF